MQIVYRHTDEQPAAKQKRVPSWKNEAVIQAVVDEIIRENDEKILKKLKQKSLAANEANPNN